MPFSYGIEQAGSTATSSNHLLCLAPVIFHSIPESLPFDPGIHSGHSLKQKYRYVMETEHPTRKTGPLCLLSLLGLLTGCTIPDAKVDSTRVWITHENSHSRPAQIEFPELALRSVRCKKNIGLCFSGGGSVSAMATTGQLRALHELGLLRQVRYISAVSGGAWGAIPYVFHDAGNGNLTLERLLGEFKCPDQLTVGDFPRQSPGHYFGIPDPADEVSLASSLNANAFVTKHLVRGLLANGDENYARALNRIYLAPLGLGDTTRFFTHDRETLREALRRNPELARSDFYVVNEQPAAKPFLIANSYLVKRYHANSFERLYHMELTPYYSGVRRFDPDTHRLPIGGGMVETYAMDSIPAEPATGDARRVEFHRDFYPGVRLEFSLSDVMAATGSAPTVPRGLSHLSDVFGFPEFRHWAPGDASSKADEYLVTDGGTIDNLGIQALLARRVETVFVFLNNETSFLSRNEDGELVMPLAISTLFGRGDESKLKGRQKWKKQANQVFPESDFDRLVDQFDAKLARGETLVVESCHRTIGNRLHQVPCDVPARVIWFVMAGIDGEKPRQLPQDSGGINLWTNETEWWCRLSGEVKAQLESFEIRTFPFYPTFLATQNNLIALGVEKTEPLAHYTAFQVWRNRELVKCAFRETP